MIKSELDKLKTGLDEHTPSHRTITYILDRLWPELESAIKEELPDPTLNFYCVCAEKGCEHPPGQKCGKPIDQSKAQELLYQSADKQSGGWMCEECKKRSKALAEK